MASVIDEYGTITGLLTLKNVLERIVGGVDDEFGNADSIIVPEGSDDVIANGTTLNEEARRFPGIR